MFWKSHKKNSTGFAAYLLVSASPTGDSVAAVRVPADVEMFLYIYIPLKVVIVAGNLLTIVAVAADRTRHTTPYVFTASLAVADLLIGLSVVYDILLLAAPELQPTLTCPINFIMCAALAESAQCTTLIALDRTLVIKYSLRYPVWLTRTRTAAVVSVTAAFSLAYSALILSFDAEWLPDMCDIWTVLGTHDSLLPKVLPLCVFLLITGCLYSYVLVLAYRQRVAIAKVHSVIPLSQHVAPQIYSITKKMSITAVASPKLYPGNIGSSCLKSASGVSPSAGALREATASFCDVQDKIHSDCASQLPAGGSEDDPEADSSETASVTNHRRKISLILPSGESSPDSEFRVPSLAGSEAEAFPNPQISSWCSLPNLSELTKISGKCPNQISDNVAEFAALNAAGALRGLKRELSVATVGVGDAAVERPPVRNSSLPAFPSSSTTQFSQFTDNSSIASRRDITIEIETNDVTGTLSQTALPGSNSATLAVLSTPGRGSVRIPTVTSTSPVRATNRMSTDTRASTDINRSSFFCAGRGSGLWKSFRMFFLVWGIYFLTLTPIILSAVVFACISVPQKKIDFIVRIDIIFIFVNSGINVFIYAWKDKRLRKSLWLVLRCKWNAI